MFGFLKTFVRKLVEESPADNQPDQAGAVLDFPEPVQPPPTSSSSRGARPLAASPQKNGQPAAANGKGVLLPLQPILNGLPLELQPKVRQPNVADRTIAVPLEKILAQLSRGAVHLPFGELRQAAPDVFAPELDRDRVMVLLPLVDILAKLNPALITRRRVQRTVEVPEEISSPFDAQGQGLVFSIGPSKMESAPAPVRQKQPAQAPVPAAPPTRSSLTSAPTPPPPAAAPPSAPAMIPATRALRELNGNRPAPAQISPLSPAVPSIPGGANDRLGMAGAPASSVAPPAPAPTPAAATTDAPTLNVTLTALAEAWPDSVRKEIVEANLVDAKVALPHEAVKQALKQGRIAFSWKSIRSWIKAANVPVASPDDATVLELPLKVVAPLFLARQQESQKEQQKVAVDVEIPNLFFGFPQAEGGGNAEVGGGAAPSVAPRPSDTNYYVWSDTSDTAHVDASDVKRGIPGPGTRFVAKYATPNEVVSRAAGLEGVAGALIALPDGLMVANQIPSDLNADTIAAFLPQIFGKVSACTKELRMGDLNNLNFTVGNVPWKIFRVNAIFFAAFGRAGEPLPTAPLAALAAELDHKPK